MTRLDSTLFSWRRKRTRAEQQAKLEKMGKFVTLLGRDAVLRTLVHD